MLNVLLIDDHPVVRAGLKAILNSFEDVQVIAEGSDGSAALALIEPDYSGPQPDVVVMDIQMPGISGIEATRQLKAAGGPPVLVLSTYDSEADILAALSAGAIGYLLKDAPEHALHDAVLRTASGQRTLAPEVAATLAERISHPEEALSEREIEILQALASGATNRELAAQMFISLATVKTHLIHIFRKLGVDTRTAAVTVAREKKLIS
ncbi:response regulator transcription factor [Corynebacterium spheniscorum]|uniref:Two component transcriptional regulator, LuxR family n=1 Tax=Corynebacterium spheniscorum TaxID=185761 RepID=A0A1I2UPC4_9CORY|nr:response regulator transcription factor [Corynebacterium spheniscorum]KAA8720204.1 response regulator transcription factor [Corynebacterium spheniscorum]SFG78089.1 two component transcriptional regulator, LuxR family [Corynebacterium spheniscorum]